MISSYKDYPVVGFGQALGIALRHILVAVSALETESAITCHNQEGVAHRILHTHLEHQTVEVAVDVARNDNGFCGGEFIGFISVDYPNHFLPCFYIQLTECHIASTVCTISFQELLFLIHLFHKSDGFKKCTSWQSDKIANLPSTVHIRKLDCTFNPLLSRRNQRTLQISPPLCHFFHFQHFHEDDGVPWLILQFSTLSRSLFMALSSEITRPSAPE